MSSSFFALLRSAAVRFDQSPVSPSSLAAVLSRLGPSPTPGCSVAWDDVRSAFRAEPAPVRFSSSVADVFDSDVFDSFVFHLSRLRLVAVVNRIADRFDRSVHGWAPADTHNMDLYISRVLSDMLEHLAEHGVSWPGEHNGFPSPEQWHEMLLENAAALREYAQGWVVEDELSSRWFDVASTLGAQSPQAQELFMSLEDAELSRHEKARSALHWFADNVHLLWD